MKNPTIIGVGREPKVIGTAFGLEQGKLSKPIEGENGVYVVELKSTVKAPALSDYKSYATALESVKVSRAAQEVYNALFKSADIEDNRSTFY